MSMKNKELPKLIFGSFFIYGDLISVDKRLSSIGLKFDYSII